MRFAVGQAQQHESAATDVPRSRMHYSQGKTCGHGRIHGIPALLHHRHTSLGRLLMNTHHDGAFCMNRPQPIGSQGSGKGESRYHQDNELKNQRFTQSFHASSGLQTL